MKNILNLVSETQFISQNCYLFSFVDVDIQQKKL